MQRFIAVLGLFISLSLITGCATFTHMTQLMDVGEASASGNPGEAIEIFDRYYPNRNDIPVEKDLAPFLTSYCAAHLTLLKFDDYKSCINWYGQYIGMPDNAEDTDKSMYYIFLANMAWELGDDDLIMKYAKMALQAESQYTPMRPWELIATVHAHRGEYEQVTAYMKKIDNFRIEVLFGLITAGEEAISGLQRDALTRIYIEMGDSKNAKKILNRPLREKSASQTVLEGLTSILETYSASLESAGEKAVRTGVEEASKPKQGENKKPADWNYYSRILQLSMAARISLLINELDQALTIYKSLLKEPNFKYQKSFYFDAMKDLSEIHYRQNKYSDAIKHALHGVSILEQTMPYISSSQERASFIKRREGIYIIIKNALSKSGQISHMKDLCIRIKDKSGYLPTACRAKIF